MSNPLITGAYAPQQQGNGGSPTPQLSGAVVVDGTPMRVAALGLSSALALWALRWAGFKFNVGVS